MKRVFVGILTTTCALQLSVGHSAFAASVSLESSVETAQRALEQQQYKKAETALRKAIDPTQTANSQDVNVARALVLLATACRGSEKVAAAGEALDEAHTIYKALGFVEPAYADELKNLSDSYQKLDLAALGPASVALKENSASISMSKAGSGGHVEIRMPAPYQTQLNNAKVDGVQLDKLVTFDIEQPSSDNIHLNAIKGFKIHSVEKNTWVNLMELSIGAPDSDGKYAATITAGKAGITKTVPSKLPVQAYEPVEAIAKYIARFGSPTQLDLPVVAAKTDAQSPQSPAASTPETSAATTTNTTTSTPAATSSVSATTSTPAAASIVSTPPSTPAATTSPTGNPTTTSINEGTNEIGTSTPSSSTTTRTGSQPPNVSSSVWNSTTSDDGMTTTVTPTTTVTAPAASANANPDNDTATVTVHPRTQSSETKPPAETTSQQTTTSTNPNTGTGDASRATTSLQQAPVVETKSEVKKKEHRSGRKHDKDDDDDDDDGDDPDNKKD